MKVIITKATTDHTYKVWDYTTTEELEEQELDTLYEYKEQKDWTGNTQAVMATLNASSHSKEDREINDYYATPPLAVQQLLDRETFALDILEPACWQWHISKVLIENKKIVVSSDLIDRSYWLTIDFLWPVYSNPWFGDIITNPPFSMATEFLEKGMDIIQPWNKFAMLLRIQFLEWVKRHGIFKKYPPKKVYVFSRNIRCAKNWDFENATGNASTYCWFVWEKWFTWSPTIDWII